MLTIPQKKSPFYRWYKLTIPSHGWFMTLFYHVLPTLIMLLLLLMMMLLLLLTILDGELKTRMNFS